MLTYCNIATSCFQIGALVALFFGIKAGEVSPLNLAMLVGLMMAETSSSRSMLALTIFTTILLAVDPTNRVDYSSVVVSIVGLFLIVLLMSLHLWYHAPDSALAELYGRKKPLQTGDNPELGAASGTQFNKQPSEVKVGTFNHIIPELTADDNPSFARRSRTIGPKKLSGFWSKAFGTDRHNSPRESIPPQDSLPNRTEYHDIVDRDSKDELQKNSTPLEYKKSGSFEYRKSSSGVFARENLEIPEEPLNCVDLNKLFMNSQNHLLNLQRTQIAFSVIEEVIVLAQDDGNIVLSNLSAISSGREFLIQYPSLSLWKLNQDTPCHFTALARPDTASNVYLGKLTCLNLKVFTEILKRLDVDARQSLGIEGETVSLCERICSKMREASVDSFQELDRRVQLHGPVTVLKFLNSDNTGAKDGLQFDPKFPDVSIEIDIYQFFKLLEDIMKLLKLEMWSQGSSSLKQLVFELNVNDEVRLLVRLVQIDGRYHYYLNVSKVTQESVLRERANQMEFMTQLISSLGHELNTPITEITKQIELFIKQGKQGSSPEKRSRKGFVFGSGRNTDDKLSKVHLHPIEEPTSYQDLSIPSEQPPLITKFVLDHTVSADPAILDSVHQTCMRLSYLISSMLSYSQILNGQELTTSNTDLFVKSVLDEVAGLFKAKAAKKGLSILVVCDPRIKVETDRRRLVGCLCLFMDNSIKFSNTQGEKIFLGAEISPDQSMVTFKVVDFGNGINKRDMELITKIMSNPFMAAVTSSSAGLGIGLRMAECIISELSGNSGKSLEIQSKLQHGTTIRFQLPLKEVVGATMQEHMDPTKLSVAGLLGLALLKPKFLQTIRLDATYETEREKLLNQLPIDGNNSSEKYDSTKELSKMLDIAKLKEVAKSIEVMIFKQSNQLASSVVVPLGRNVINNTSRIQKKNSLTATKMLSSSKGSRVLSNIVITKPTKKVMIVDDEVFLLEFLRDVLEDRGLEVFTASGPERAFDLSALLGQMGKKIDMVYMDFNMPGMNGAECVAILKSDQYLSSMESAHFTAVTAQDDSKVRGLFAQVGVEDFIAKPYSVEQIDESLTKHNLLSP